MAELAQFYYWSVLVASHEALPVHTRRVNPQALANSRSARCMQDSKPYVGNAAPDFKAECVLDQEFVTRQLSDYRGKYLCLFFYPLDFTFVCPTEITAFSDRYAEFKALDCEVLGVSVDSQFSHLAWIQTPRNEGGLGDLEYGLLADLKKEVRMCSSCGGFTRAVQALLTVPALHLVQVSSAYGVLTDDGIALRGLFLIDREGIIQHSTINNLAFGRWFFACERLA